uniref:UBC core domain-containing protein n=1 Tax=Araucaria cunninghamii TaxID=56994 RepID=A0A0D6QTV7_ARACU
MELGRRSGMGVLVENGVRALNFQSGVESRYDSDDRDEVRVTQGLLNKCRHQDLGSVFVTSCMHNNCRICLKSHVESVLGKSMRTIKPSYDEIRVQLLCPDQRCGMELSKADLINLLDIDTVENYENWLRTACKDLYANVTNCIKCQQGKATKCPFIEGKENAKINDDVNKFQSAQSIGSIGCLDRWVCADCEFSWCAACGFTFNSQCKVDGREGTHICREAINYAINDIVANIESIYNEYTRVTNKNDVQPAATNISDHPPDTSSPFNDNPPGEISMLHGGENHQKSVWGAGTGYGGNRSEGLSTQESARKHEKELDCQAENELKSLTSILKNKAEHRLATLGWSAYALLTRGNVVSQLLAYLVMNDSMMDICARRELYIQLADLLENMARYPELLMMLIRPSSQAHRKGGPDVDGDNGSDICVFKRMKNIYEQSKIMVSRFTDGKHDTDMEADIGIASCLLECYEKLATAAEKQTLATPSVISFSNEEDSGMARDDSELARENEVTSDQMSSASKEEFSENMEDNEVSSEQDKNVSVYKESLKPLQFAEYSFLGTGFQHHTYSKHFDESGSNKQSIDNEGVHNKKRMLHILKEIASLATNLPLEWESSIHVRVDPVRMDLLKTLIVGPQGTPYQNGVFIFDIYLPPDYPQVPPKVTFLTTGGGKVRFNPNLYHDGKVCLSLLGTWNGPSWQPWKSTLLQVLVSFQSLIFVADPYYNEPGFEHHTNSQGAAEEENRSHRYNTLKYAILGALQNPDPSFKDLILMHFRQKKDEIMCQCDEWVKACGDPTHHLYNKLVETADNVKLELVKVSTL